MSRRYNVLKVGATRQGKTLSAACDALTATDETYLVFDPHKDSLAKEVLTHAVGDVLFERLSDIKATLGFDLLAPSADEQENELRGAAFVSVLLRRRNSDGLATTPLMEEWVLAAIDLYLWQSPRKPLTILPYAFLPGTDEFASLLRDCRRADVRYKFRQLEKLNPRALRAEVGSALRLITAVFRSVAFQARCRGGFDLGGHLQRRGKLIVERGDLGEDANRVIMGAIILLVIEHAKRRPKPFPPIRIYIDEAVNAGLVGAPELKGLAETNKNGLYWTLLVQNLNFPGGSDEVLQNCLRHEWFGCGHYELARKAATDIVAGLPRSDEESRAERVARIADEILNFPPGWRWVREPGRAWKEYVPLLENPWPDWPGLREAKLREKLQWIFARPEYGVPDTPSSSTSSSGTPPPPASSPKGSSPAERWKRGRKRPDDGSASSDAGSASP